MITTFLVWLDLCVFNCRWRWLCNMAWDRQMARDIANCS